MTDICDEQTCALDGATTVQGRMLLLLNGKYYQHQYGTRDSEYWVPKNDDILLSLPSEIMINLPIFAP